MEFGEFIWFLFVLGGDHIFEYDCHVKYKVGYVHGKRVCSLGVVGNTKTDQSIVCLYRLASENPLLMKGQKLAKIWFKVGLAPNS